MAGPETEAERERMILALRQEQHPGMKMTPEEDDD